MYIMLKNHLFIFLLCLSIVSCNSERNKYFDKTLSFPENISADQKIKLSSYLIPSTQQYEWQQLELTAFIHFGINTFTGREWGDGKEDPALFNPTDFNAEQWVLTLKDAGFKMLILTAKHHDGFCLWPSKTTLHSVVSSPWRSGKGDVVKEVKEACDKHGLKFGVYLSPWDRNAESYGDSPKYNEMFLAQLTELLSNYGEIHEVWFDGANGEGPNGKVQEYDWDSYYKLIAQLQPNSVTAIMGNDVRWVGNESGLGRETEWSVTPLNPDVNNSIKEENKRLNISPTAKDLGSRNLIEQANKLYWYPSEVDVSIRPGWFYHPEEDKQVKTLQQLVDIYYKSVGMNSVLLLNIPPDTRGQLSDADVERLKQFGSYIKNIFKENKILKGDHSWSAEPGEMKEFDLVEGEVINTLMIQEDILKGQRIESFKVEALSGNEWVPLTEGTTVGYKRLLKFDDITPSKVRITLLESREKVNFKYIGAYYAPQIDELEFSLHLNDLDKEKWVLTNESPLIVDMGEAIEATGFTYLPDSTKESVFTFNFSLSEDGKTWTSVSKGEFSNIKNNPIAQTKSFENKLKSRFFRFETISGTDGGQPLVDITQIGILTSK